MSSSPKTFLILASFLISLIVLVAAVMPVFGDEAKTASVPQVTKPSYEVPKGPLTVPVFPRGADKGEMPDGADLRDSYIMLEDGSVLSVADWILGSLKKDEAGIGMSDYEQRLFLGQVARAAAGLDENLVNRSLVHTQPTLSFKAVPTTKDPAMIALKVLARHVIGAILPGTPKDWNPATSGGGFSPLEKARGDSTYLFDEQFNDAMNQTVAELKHSGTMQIMRDEQLKKLKKNIAKKLKPKVKQSAFSFAVKDREKPE